MHIQSHIHYSLTYSSICICALLLDVVSMSNESNFNKTGYRGTRVSPSDTVIELRDKKSRLKRRPSGIGSGFLARDHKVCIYI